MITGGQNWSQVTYTDIGFSTVLDCIQAFYLASPIAQYDAQAMAWIFSIAGAFPLIASSNDQVYFGNLLPGAHTIEASDATVGPSGGTALVEV